MKKLRQLIMSFFKRDPVRTEVLGLPPPPPPEKVIQGHVQFTHLVSEVFQQKMGCVLSIPQETRLYLDVVVPPSQEGMTSCGHLLSVRDVRLGEVWEAERVIQFRRRQERVRFGTLLNNSKVMGS